MKSTFVIPLAWAILLAFGFIDSAESQEISCRKYERIASSGDVKDFLVAQMEQTQIELDFCKDSKIHRAAKRVIAKRQEKLNEWMEMPEKLNKTEEMLKESTEMLNATEEAKMELEGEFGKCGKKLNKMEENFGECLLEMNKMEQEYINKTKEQIGKCRMEMSKMEKECMNKMKEQIEKCRMELKSHWPWKVLAIIFIGITAALLLFNVAVVAYYFYKLRSSKNLRIHQTSNGQMDAF